MSFMHRAFLYVTRKTARSLSLLLILLVIATLALSGAAIKEAVGTAQLNVRQALGGSFMLQQNTSDSSKWVSTSVGQYGSTSYYGGAPLTEELASYIQDNVAGITGCNAAYTNYTVPVAQGDSILELVESEDDEGEAIAPLTEYEDLDSTVSTYASTNTSYSSYFHGGYLELVEGRHLVAGDKNVALVSKELAELNGLKVGDRIALRMPSFKASMLNYEASDTSVEVEIVGLFRPTVKSTTALPGSSWSMDNSIFTTMEVVRTARPDMGDESYENISFYVDDPGEIDRIVSEVQNLPDVDPSDFVVSVDSSSADAVMEPLANMDRLVSVLIALVLVVGAVILCLVLAARVKDRMHESGVLLSLGLSKGSIVAQYLAEILLVAVLAFPGAVFVSGFVAQAVGNQLLDYSLDSTPQASSTSSGLGDPLDGVYSMTSSDLAPQFEGANESLTQIDVSVEPLTVAVLYGVCLLIICGAVLIATLPVLRMRPREIVARLS